MQDAAGDEADDEDFLLVGGERIVECADPVVGLSEIKPIASGIVTRRSVERLAVGVDGQTLVEAAL